MSNQATISFSKTARLDDVQSMYNLLTHYTQICKGSIICVDISATPFGSTIRGEVVHTTDLNMALTITDN
jgi:hypothetical protein